MIDITRRLLARLGTGRLDELQRKIATLEKSLKRSDAIIDVLLCDTEFSPSESAGMNGQWGRKKVVTDLFDVLKFENVIETGTFFGMTAGYLWSTFAVPVTSCEAVKRHYHVSKRLLRSLPGVKLELNDSRAFLRSLSANKDCIEARTFFYLDAHWYEDLPLLDELSIIAGSWREYAIMIDDFRVPDDSGYLYDDYGGGMSLELAYVLPTLRQRELDAYFPTLASSKESGKKRGCVVLARPELRSRLDRVESLTRFDDRRIASLHSR